MSIEYLSHTVQTIDDLTLRSTSRDAIRRDPSLASSARGRGRSAAALLLLGLCLATSTSLGQVVNVTAQLETNVVSVGQSTMLRVYAQVAAPYQASAERIFSWYVDVENTNSTTAAAQYDSLVKPAADNDPSTSSTGFNDGANRRGIYDTFESLPGAGVTNPVVLMEIQVTGQAVGQTRFAVSAGSGVPELAEDFIVATVGGGDFLSGGNYGVALADLAVIQAGALQLQIARIGGGGPDADLQLSFNPLQGFNHTVEFMDELSVGPWQPWPGGPHNSGIVTVTNDVPNRFFRVVATPQ